MIEFLETKFNKIISKQFITYDLLAQMFTNKRFSENYDAKTNVAYQDFLNKRRKDHFND